MVKKIVKASALDLEIKGSVGTFSVAEGGAGSSVQVRYIQTHVRLATGGDHQEKLLSKLAPVREVFPIAKLDFAQIMQRDIDDARVSAELIPYLLEDSATSGLVKLFPPIVVVVIPTTAGGLPADYYPSVVAGTEVTGTEEGDEDTWSVVRSGPVGAEVFEFKQILEEGVTWDHDYATLKLNTQRSELVIVDGQHRAMALIALYRNLKKWPQRSTGAEPYYKLWSPDLISKYKLDDVKLPVMFCTFPQLDGSDVSLPKVYAACRAIFLALNKNARKVTEARNHLLNDRDLISTLMRSVLTQVKSGSDAQSDQALRLWNIELDADRDRTVITSPVAITGVSHLFGLIERLMLGNRPKDSLSASRQRLSTRSRLDECLTRLQARDDIPSDHQKALRRDTCDSATEDLLTKKFQSLYGGFLVTGLSNFAPYWASNSAALELETKLSTGATAEFYRGILFEGQGMDRVFRDFCDSLERELPGNVNSPELAALKKEFKDRQKELRDLQEELFKRRHEILFEGVPKKVREDPEVFEAIKKLYRNTFTAAAFQYSIFLTFCYALEEVDCRRGVPPNLAKPLLPKERRELFDLYLKQLNEFFRPKDRAAALRLLRTFSGRVDVADDGSITVSSWDGCLRNILISGELKPDEWTKFRFVLAELWRPEHEEVAAVLRDLRSHLRKQALDKFTDRKIRGAASEKGLPVGGLDDKSMNEIKKECVDQLLKGIKNLGSDIARPELSAFLEEPEVAEEAEEAEEG